MTFRPELFAGLLFFALPYSDTPVIENSRVVVSDPVLHDRSKDQEPHLPIEGEKREGRGGGIQGGGHLMQNLISIIPPMGSHRAGPYLWWIPKT